jgi:sugar phosphate isomerase/epimerase
MRISRRQFLSAGGALLGAAALGVRIGEAQEGDDSMSPAINPEYLTGSAEDWPLNELASIGYRGLEVSPQAIADLAAWKPAADHARLRILCVNALPELRPYLTGSLSDAVERRRRDTLRRLLATLERMRQEGIPLLVVAPSRLAENYQTPDEARALLVAGLRELASVGDTTILLEGAPFRMFSSSEALAGIVDEVACPNVAAALNVGHALLNGSNPAEAAKALGPRLRYLQAHDADLRPGVPRLDRHLPLGTGMAQKEDVRSALGELPFAVTVTAPADPLAAARDALEWLS